MCASYFELRAKSCEMQWKDESRGEEGNILLACSMLVANTVLTMAHVFSPCLQDFEAQSRRVRGILVRVCVFKLSYSQRHYRSERYSLFCFVLSPLPEVLSLLPGAMSVQESEIQVVHSPWNRACTQSLVIISGQVLHTVIGERSHRYGNMTISNRKKTPQTN